MPQPSSETETAISPPRRSAEIRISPFSGVYFIAFSTRLERTRRSVGAAVRSGGRKNDERSFGGDLAAQRFDRNERQRLVAHGLRENDFAGSVDDLHVEPVRARFDDRIQVILEHVRIVGLRQVRDGRQGLRLRFDPLLESRRGELRLAFDRVVQLLAADLPRFPEIIKTDQKQRYDQTDGQQQESRSDGQRTFSSKRSAFITLL